jgi:glycosyltransferase involved in cell wall biosynthesis
MRILILSQWCYPEPDLKALTFATELKKRGHEVQVLTGFPNYPGGKLYPGYRIRLFQKEIIDGVEILRVPLYPSHDKSGVKRILNYLSFGISAALIGVFRVRKADILYVYHPPPTVAIAAFTIKLFRRIPVVYDIQDMWPDTLKSTGMISSPRILKVVDGYMKFCYRYFNQIVVLSSGFKDLLVKRGVDASKVNVIYNWSNPINVPGYVDPAERIEVMGTKFTILFAGTIGVAQGLDIVLEAAALLQKNGIDDIQFALLGGGTDVERLKNETAARKLKNILFLKRVPANEVGKLLAMADVLLIHLIEDKLFEITVPSKTQAYLLAGKPILAGIRGDAAKLIERAGAGYSFQPQNTDELIENIMKLKQMSPGQLAAIGKNGKHFYMDRLSIEKGVDSFEHIFNGLCNNKKDRTKSSNGVLEI